MGADDFFSSRPLDSPRSILRSTGGTQDNQYRTISPSSSLDTSTRLHLLDPSNSSHSSSPRHEIDTQDLSTSLPAPYDLDYDTPHDTVHPLSCLQSSPPSPSPSHTQLIQVSFQDNTPSSLSLPLSLTTTLLSTSSATRLARSTLRGTSPSIRVFTQCLTTETRQSHDAALKLAGVLVPHSLSTLTHAFRVLPGSRRDEN